MQVKVQVKCMTYLFCPSIRGAGLWPPSSLCSPWGWYRMDFLTWRCPRPAPGKTAACQRVNVGLPTLGMGKLGKPAKPHPIQGLLAASAPFHSCPLCSQHTNRSQGHWQGLWTWGTLLCYVGLDSRLPFTLYIPASCARFPQLKEFSKG